LVALDLNWQGAQQINMHYYVLALGSNQRHPVHGSPARVINAAISLMGDAVLSRAKTILTPPIGPSSRRYANTAIVIETIMPPDDLLQHVKAMERQFGRKIYGQRWRSRVLDIDLILWSGGAWVSPELSIPHLLFRDRGFVLQPASEIAANWRDPIRSKTLQHLAFQNKRNRNRFWLE
jgi:2-amino-4-hydroxy-6-hydroxymethyldihydropteridine diphosphokinase